MFKELTYWFKTEVWWSITRWYTWTFTIRTEPEMINPETDLYVSSDDHYDYYQMDNIKGRIYRVKR